MAKPLKVLMVSQYLNRGGGARAAERIFLALQSVSEETGVVPHLHAVKGKASASSISLGLPGVGAFGSLGFWMRVHLHRIMSRFLFRPEDPSLHSTAAVTTGLLESVQVDWDVVHLNWLGDSTLSIEEIGRTQRPIVWTLHDMWPYCGAEHQTRSNRYVEGYLPRNRPSGERGPDINRSTWERKKKSWKKLPTVVAPSLWSARNVKESALLGRANITEIPHPLDTEFWSPSNKKTIYIQPGFAEFRPLRIGLPAPLESKEWGKGLPLIQQIIDAALESKSGVFPPVELWAFGGRKISVHHPGLTVSNFGWLNDVELRDFYRRIDLLMFPSTIDTYGMVAAEAQSCGTPVVCFRDTGVESVVEHQVTGFTASHQDLGDFAKGLRWCTSSIEKMTWLSEQSRARALRLWDMKKIGRQYASVFREAVSRVPENRDD